MTLTKCWTTLYMAPEILKGELYIYKVEIGSLGASMFETLIEVIPYNGSDK
jgi:serine/threonine protein kinase